MSDAGDDEIDRKVAFSEQARQAKAQVLKKFGEMIDRDPERAAAAVRALLRNTD